MGTYVDFRYFQNGLRSLPTKTQPTETINDKGIPEYLHRFSALLLLLSAFPILLMVAIAIRIESPGAAIFSQSRIGLNCRRFRLYKFRSMYVNGDNRRKEVNNLSSDREGVCKKFVNDPRITQIGRFIRKTSIDELPQLWNVVIGDMLLIGPRPALPKEVDEYSYRTMKRLNVKPGLTGLWQISGRADTTFEEQVNLDLKYIKNQSFLFDLKILFLTIPAVTSGKGAY